MAHTLQILSVIFFAVAGACLVLAVFFWFFFKIPTVIGDLSGKTARKSIAKMRAANEKTGTKYYKTSKINAERGKLTGTIPDIDKKREVNKNPETAILAENKADGLNSETTQILDNDETDILDNEATGLLVDEDSTALPGTAARAGTGGKSLELIEEVMIIHTNEVI